MAVSVALCHATVIGGTLLTAVGNEVLITEPLGQPQGAWVMLMVGGAVLFLVGRIMYHLLVYQRLPWPGLVGLGILGLLSPVMLLFQPLIIALVTNAALFGAVAVDLYLIRKAVRQGRLITPSEGTPLAPGRDDKR